MCTPSQSIKVAHVWRRSCKRISGRPARFRIGLKLRAIRFLALYRGALSAGADGQEPARARALAFSVFDSQTQDSREKRQSNPLGHRVQYKIANTAGEKGICRR